MKATILLMSDRHNDKDVETMAAVEEIIRDFREILTTSPEIMQMDDGNVLKFYVNCKDRSQGHNLVKVFYAVLQRHGLMNGKAHNTGILIPEL